MHVAPEIITKALARVKREGQFKSYARFSSTTHAALVRNGLIIHVEHGWYRLTAFGESTLAAEARR